MHYLSIDFFRFVFLLHRLTTVGYGRLYPVATSGKMVAMLTGGLGTLYLAMPLSIVGSKFYTIYSNLDDLRNEERKSKLKKKIGMFIDGMKKLRLLGNSASPSLSAASASMASASRSASISAKGLKESSHSKLLRKYYSDLDTFVELTQLYQPSSVNESTLSTVKVCISLKVLLPFFNIPSHRMYVCMCDRWVIHWLNKYLFIYAHCCIVETVAENDGVSFARLYPHKSWDGNETHIIYLISGTVLYGYFDIMFFVNLVK